MGSFPETPEAYNDLFQHFSVVRCSTVRPSVKQNSRLLATNGLLSKRRLRNDYKNSIVMTCHYSDLGSASDWMKQIFNQSEAPPRPEWPVISMESLQSFLRHHFKETSVGVAKYQLFPPSNAKICLQQVPTKSEIIGKLILVIWMGGHRWRFHSFYYTFHFQKWQSQNAT